MRPFWVTAFLDLPSASHVAGAGFWARLTASTLSAPRGPDGEFATLLPADGDAYLKVQRIDGPPRIHLDLHVADVGADVPGATVIAEHDDYRTLVSPGGFTFCLVDHPASVRPRSTTALLDQVCLDIPPSAYEQECRFWGDATGWELRHHGGSEFSSLVRPDGVPLRLLLQRLDGGSGPVTAHLDWACADRDAEVQRQRALGAELIERYDGWTVLRDPAGLHYCCTDRDPVTGLVT